MRRALVVLTLVILLVAVAVVVLRRPDRDAASPDARPAAVTETASPAPGTGTDGFAFVAGKYVAPPYVVSFVDDAIELNGETILSLPDERADPKLPTEPKDAFDVVALAEARLPDTEVVAAADRAELLSYVKSLAATADVIESEASFEIVDRAGNRELLLLNRHLVNRGAQAKALEARAKDLDTLLNSGGLLMATADTTVEVSGAVAPSILGKLASAMEEDDADRQARIEQLLGAAPVAASLAAADRLPKAVLDRLPEPAEGEAQPRITLQNIAFQSAPSDIRTPGSDKAYVVDWFAEPDTGPPRVAARDQGYTVVSYSLSGELRDSAPADRIWRAGDPEERRLPDGRVIWFHPRWMWGVVQQIRNFFTMSQNGGAGLLYVSTHGHPEAGLMLTGGWDGSEDLSGLLKTSQAYEDDYAGPRYRDAREELESMLKEELGLVKGKDYSYKPDGMWIWPGALGRHWRDASSIVHLAACYGSGFGAIFNAREFIAPGGMTFTFKTVGTGEWEYSQPNDFAVEFYERLNGKREKGEKRAVGDAFAASTQALSGVDRYQRLGASGFFRHDGSGKTVLAPAVTAKKFENSVQTKVVDDAGVEKPNEVSGSIEFDAAMAAVTPKLVVEASGSCKPELIEDTMRWEQDRALSITFRAHENGIAIFRLRVPHARSSGNGTPLDGNTDPSRTDRVGPNGDVYEWQITCMC